MTPAAPPAILIAWSAEADAWCATAVISADPAPIAVAGPSCSPGATPALALDALLGRRFGILSDEDCPATVVSISEAELR